MAPQDLVLHERKSRSSYTLYRALQPSCTASVKTSVTLPKPLSEHRMETPPQESRSRLKPQTLRAVLTFPGCAEYRSHADCHSGTLCAYSSENAAAPPFLSTRVRCRLHTHASKWETPAFPKASAVSLTWPDSLISQRRPGSHVPAAGYLRAPPELTRQRALREFHRAKFPGKRAEPGCRTWLRRPQGTQGKRRSK